MMVLVDNHVWRVRAGDAPEPVDAFSDSVVHVCEGTTISAAALQDGSLEILAQNGQVTRQPSGSADPITSLLVLHEHPLEILAGTENPRLFRIKEDGSAPVDSFDQLECREQWYTPWGGPPALRSFGRGGNGWVYADIHVGSIMRSADEGHAWEPVTPTLHVDVHHVACPPTHPTRVVANTAHAVYVSDDCGSSWEYRGEPLGGRYGRALATHPDDPDCFLATVSDGPHGDNVHGQLYRTANAGRTWDHVTNGFPENTPANINTFHVTFTPDGVLWACVGRNLLHSPDCGAHWQRVWQAPATITMIHADTHTQT